VVLLLVFPGREAAPLFCPWWGQNPGKPLRRLAPLGIFRPEIVLREVNVEMGSCQGKTNELLRSFR
jgi:hypothetical protein